MNVEKQHCSGDQLLRTVIRHHKEHATARGKDKSKMRACETTLGKMLIVPDDHDARSVFYEMIRQSCSAFHAQSFGKGPRQIEEVQPRAFLLTSRKAKHSLSHVIRELADES